MNIDITGRHVEVTPALRDFTEDKLRKLERLLVGPLEVHVVLGIEKHRHTAEIQVKSRTAVLSGTRETGDLYASIGEVVDKLERQALKHKEKLHDHKLRRGDSKIAAEIETRASAEPPASGPDGRPQIYRSQRYRIKPLSAEDAALDLEATGEDILVFRDLQTDRVCVLYREKDGNFGLIEPEF